MIFYENRFPLFGIMRLVQAAEKPDQHQDRQWNPEQPKQQIASHDGSSLVLVLLMEGNRKSAPEVPKFHAVAHRT